MNRMLRVCAIVLALGLLTCASASAATLTPIGAKRGLTDLRGGAFGAAVQCGMTFDGEDTTYRGLGTATVGWSAESGAKYYLVSAQYTDEAAPIFSDVNVTSTEVYIPAPLVKEDKTLEMTVKACGGDGQILNTITTTMDFRGPEEPYELLIRDISEANRKIYIHVGSEYEEYIPCYYTVYYGTNPDLLDECFQYVLKPGDVEDDTAILDEMVEIGALQPGETYYFIVNAPGYRFNSLESKLVSYTVQGTN